MKSINIQTLHTLLEDESFFKNTLLLDVRTDEEWKKMRIAGSVHIPLDDLESRLVEVDSQKDIICICFSGGRSIAAAEILENNGFSSVSNLENGIFAWKMSKLPLEE